MSLSLPYSVPLKGSTTARVNVSLMLNGIKMVQWVKVPIQPACRAKFDPWNLNRHTSTIPQHSYVEIEGGMGESSGSLQAKTLEFKA